MKKILLIKASLFPPSEEAHKAIQDFVGKDYLVIWADIEEPIYIKEI